MIYLKPSCISFAEIDMLNATGPMQTAYVELQIYYQQIPQAQTKMTTVEKLITTAKNEQSFIYDLNNIA